MCGKVANFKDVLPSHTSFFSSLNKPYLLILVSWVVPLLIESGLILCNQQSVAEMTLNNLPVSPTFVSWELLLGMSDPT